MVDWLRRIHPTALSNKFLCKRKNTMASKLVNLDAMIPREDFATLPVIDQQDINTESIPQIGISHLQKGSFLLPSLRKPDFQRETNHWNPEQVVSLIKSYIEGDLIPSVILWRSPQYVFVIDGGHRLSAIRAWIEDDYGDGPISKNFFGEEISNEQKKSATIVRKKIQQEIGSWKHWETKISGDVDVSAIDRRILNQIATRTISVQWVRGNAEKAEESFYRINQQGTPLDEVEEILIKHRKKPVAIAARAIIRAGMGHKYWSSFQKEKAIEIENLAREIHGKLFQPEINAPIKTLDLPLGGTAGVRNALSLLIEFILISIRGQNGIPQSMNDFKDEDYDGQLTIDVLSRTLTLTSWLTGNDRGSLGLHPAIYFYGPSGRHSVPLFMGVASWIATKLQNNDKLFFKKFSLNREKFETALLGARELIASIIVHTRSANRATRIATIMEEILSAVASDRIISDADLIAFTGLTGKIFVGHEAGGDSIRFSTDTKSSIFIRTALSTAIRCPICRGYMHVEKSVSYDHIERVEDGGKGTDANGQMTHPYCNQGLKS